MYPGHRIKKAIAAEHHYRKITFERQTSFAFCLRNSWSLPTVPFAICNTSSFGIVVKHFVDGLIKGLLCPKSRMVCSVICQKTVFVVAVGCLLSSSSDL
jgi:hypothetical protein